MNRFSKECGISNCNVIKFRRTIMYQVVMFLTLTQPAFANDTEMSSEKTSSQEPLIEEIEILVRPVFDETNPKENNWIFKLVNRLHINTKKHVITKDLTFKTGDTVDIHLLEESERRLRNQRYFSDANISLVDAPNKAQDSISKKVQVDVHEVWTLVPKLTYSTAGGATHYGYGLHDSNFLGLGKTIKIEHTSTEARTGDIIQYRDYNLGDKNQLILGYADNNDGKESEFSFSKPFSSIRTDWTSGIEYQDFLREDTYYNAGDEVYRYIHQNAEHSLYYGWKLPNSSDDNVHRLIVGWSHTNDEFSSLPEFNSDLNVELPYDRNFDSFWIEYSSFKNAYIEMYNIQQINRTEDINLGNQWRLRIGGVTANTNQMDKSIQVQLNFSKAIKISSTQMLLGELSSSGFYTNGDPIHTINQMAVSYHWQNFSRGQFYAYANVVDGKNLFDDMPLELGGDTGLRGYPVRFQAGNKLELLTLEQRFFGEKEWFSLFHMGAAVFYDQGRVWGESPVDQTYNQTLRDVGIGLRISGTRTGGKDDGIHNVAHVDLSYPLDGGTDIDKYQISVRIKKSF